MHEDLLGYVLGALEPHEMQRIERLLREDPELRMELARIKESLEPLEQDSLVFEPPADLVSRTMDALPAFEPTNPVELPSMVSGNRTRGDGELRWMDIAGGSIAAAVLLALMLPALANGRFQARKAGCADQFRNLHSALTTFAIRSPTGRLPAVAPQGPEAFAGVYAVRLSDAGLLDEESNLWCPSLGNLESRSQATRSSDSLITRSTSSQIVPSVPQLHKADEQLLKTIQRTAGGDYAYSLGVVEQDTYTPPRFEARSSFAVMSDAPQTVVQNDTIVDEYLGHDGVGINILYEDGSVRFVNVEGLDEIPDNPMLNREGQVEAGVDSEDATLGSSWQPPFQADINPHQLHL